MLLLVLNLVWRLRNPGCHTEKDTRMRLPHLTSLQGGRAIAALMVVFYHLNIFILPKRLYAETGEALHPVANMGYSGVEFFFALSGFLMLYIHRRDFGAPQKAYSYAIKRVSRIYPAYWLVLIPMVLAGALIPAVGLGYMPGLGQLLPNLFLVPMEDTPILQVSWTLQHEMLFYAIFGLAILHRWIGLGILSMWFTACALTVFGQDVLFPADFLFSPYNLIFLFGGLAAVSFQHLGRNAARGLLVGGLLVFLMTGLNDIYRPVEIGFGVRTVLFGASASAIIAALAAMETAGRLSIPRSLRLVGDASYMLYLVHMPMMTAGVPVAKFLHLPEFLPPWIMALLFVIGCTIASVVAHLYLERPLVRYISRKFGAPKNLSGQLSLADALRQAASSRLPVQHGPRTNNP
ncbi:MAG TPA: hypothetical protein DIT86_08185 [Hyphomonas sp.]|nr:hypothetical protein [Hyphomonas sp.]